MMIKKFFDQSCFRYGPLVHLWAMRFEGKHKQFKNRARGTSFKNILKTLAEHHQRLMSYNLNFNALFASVTVSTGSGELPSLSGNMLLCKAALFAVHPIFSLSSLSYHDEIKTYYPHLLEERLYRYEYYYH